jgi:resuscitation-promoting factor RpfB
MKRLTGLSTCIRGWQPATPHLLLALAAILVGFLGYDYQRTAVPFTIEYDGIPYASWTHQETIGGALVDAGLKLTPVDRVQPEPGSPLVRDMIVHVAPAAPIMIEADGRLIEWRTRQTTPVGILAEVAVALNPHDEVWVEGRPAAPAGRLDFPVSPVAVETAAFQREQAPWERPAPRALRLLVKRAAVLYVDNGGIPSILYTTAATIGEALRDHDVLLYLGDRVTPSLGNRVSTGLKVYIQRSKQIELMVDGRAARTRTRGKTVADVLAQQYVSLVGKDTVEPPESTPVREGMGIRVTRLAAATLIEQDAIAFETVWKPAADLELDQQHVDQEGREGLTRRRIEVVYRDGKETQRALQDEWIEAEPRTKVIAYGTRIVPRVLESEAGPMTYWRKVRMLATSYTAASSGKSPTHPQYGITRSGLRVDRGVVAVDSKVVGLGDKLYVPGYGQAVVGDTGGGILGRRIDLGYPDNDAVMWYRWVDVFVLGPPPPPDRIRWVLPNWPRERR